MSDHCLIEDSKALLPEKYKLMFLTVQTEYRGFTAQAKQALDVVSSLVQDLAPPDSVAKKPSATDQGSSHEQQQQMKNKKKASAEGQVQQQPRDGKKISAELQTGRKAHFTADEVPTDKADKAPADDDVAPAGKSARNGVGRKQKAGEAHADKHKAPAAAEKAARKGAGKQPKPAKEPSEAAKAPAGKAAARKGTAAAAPAAEKNSPAQSEPTAGRRARRRESKAPWWMAQVCASFPGLSSTAEGACCCAERPSIAPCIMPLRECAGRADLASWSMHLQGWGPERLGFDSLLLRSSRRYCRATGHTMSTRAYGQEHLGRPILERASLVQAMSPVAEDSEVCLLPAVPLGRQQPRKRATTSQEGTGQRCTYAFTVCTGGVTHCREHRRRC